MSGQFDRLFSEHSYGFRPQRSAHDAVKAAQQYVQEGKAWVIDIDLKAFFDHVNHDKLIYLIREQMKDKGLLRLVRKIISAGIIIEGQWQTTRCGTPQVSPLSPLLANIYLDPLDKELEKRGLSFCRYADDINIYVASERSAQRVYASIVKWTVKHLKLSVNTDKSGTGRPWDRQFLGYRITREGKLSIDSKRLERHKNKVRQLWRANQSLTSQQLVEQWRSYLTGWCNYLSLTGCMANRVLSDDARCIEQQTSEALWAVCGRRLIGCVCSLTQPPDTENRMSGGVGGVTNAISLPRPDR